MKKSFIVLALVLVMVLAACGGKTATGGVPADAALKITGNVNGEIGWSEKDVRAMKTAQADFTDKDGVTNTYTGVPLNDLLDKAGVKSDATALVLVADDSFTSEVDLAEVKACADCIVGFRDEGGFLMVMPGFSNKAQVKGVIEIQVK
ncbi:MAG TPA: molybdopterin-dependent oxidoreductase [Anaerolineales bacterium]|nr:molybdopterin-dependent oxidoreductase [Anaerolineales bacterium]